MQSFRIGSTGELFNVFTPLRENKTHIYPNVGVFLTVKYG